MSEPDLDMLERFDLPCYKTGSDDITNLPFLRNVAEKGRPMLVSTGMCTMQEIEAAVEVITGTGNSQLVLLHCVVSYPSRPEDANLRVIPALQQKFGLPVGLSDHTQDEFTSVLATQMGAAVIEKHLTLDHAHVEGQWQTAQDLGRLTRPPPEPTGPAQTGERGQGGDRETAMPVLDAWERR